MVKQHLILCGEIKTTKPENVVTHELQLGKGKICLDVESITQKMVQDLPDVIHDLLEIATYVYVGDQMVSRGGLKSFDYAEKWGRCLDFRIPVREYELWSDPKIKEQLEELLSFASGDTYSFDFVQRKRSELPKFLNLKTDITPEYEYDEILLFSGGLDSFTGAVDKIVAHKNKIVLVSHQSNNKLVGLQRKLHKYLASLCSAGPKPLHVPVMINKNKRLTQETSQRTRSFLYGALGAIIATMFKLNRVKFYENGIISCNLPFDGQTLQARSTRSTHPKLLHLFSLFISELTDSDFYFENPYFAKTKTDVVERLLELHHQKCIEDTRSCAKSVYRKPHTHCGTCSQCIDRRFATLASQCQEHDPSQLYAIDIFKEELNNIHDRAMAVGFVGFANSLESMTVDNFVQKFSSDVHEIARYISNQKYEVTLKNIFDLHYRHAVKVDKVMDAKCKENISLVRKGMLPNNCLINMVLRGEHRDIGKLFEKSKGKKTQREIAVRHDNNGASFVTERESDILEFKETLEYNVRTKERTPGLIKSSLKTVAAFLNTDGGTLLIGVSDSGEIKGLNEDLKFAKGNNLDGFEQKLRSLINDRFDPSPLGHIQITFNELQGSIVCQIDVEQSSDVIAFDNEFYIRDGNGTRKLEGRELADWLRRRNNK